MHSTEIAGLLERVRAATGPVRELDASLWYSLVEKPGPGDRIDKDMRGRWPTYTASINASLALVERFRSHGIDAATLLSDAIDRMTREGFRPDEPLPPQIARAVLIELLTAIPGGPDADR